MNKKEILKNFIAGKASFTELKQAQDFIPFKIATLKAEVDKIILSWYNRVIKVYSLAAWQTERQNWCIIQSGTIETEIEANRQRNGGLIDLDQLSDAALIEVSRTPQGCVIGIIK